MAIQDPELLIGNESRPSGLASPELKVARHIKDAIEKIDIALSNRKETISRLQREISELHRSREALVEAQRALPTTMDEPQSHSAQLSVSSRTTKRIRHQSKAEMVRVEVESLLREFGRPMKRGEIHSRLTEIGIALPGPRPEKKLSKILSSSKDRFVNEGDGYWLAAVPLP